MKSTLFPKTNVYHKVRPYATLFERQNALLLYMCRGPSFSATS